MKKTETLILIASNANVRLFVLLLHLNCITVYIEILHTIHQIYKKEELSMARPNITGNI